MTKKITKQQLEKLIQEELESSLNEISLQGMGAKIRDFFRGSAKKKEKESSATAGEPAAAQEPAADGEQEVTPDQVVSQEPAVDQQPAAVSPQAEKAKSIFTNMAKEYFNSLVKGVVSNVVKSLLASGQSADQARIAKRLGEAVEASNPRTQVFLITNAILAQINKVIDSLSTEEFAKAFSDVAKARIQDPKELNKALKSFRMAEAFDWDDAQDPWRTYEPASKKKTSTGATDDTALGAGLEVSDTFIAQLNAMLKMKGLNATSIVKQAFSSLDPAKLGLDQQKINMAMGKSIEALNAAMKNAASQANPMSGSEPAPQMMQESINRWKKLAKIKD